MSFVTHSSVNPKAWGRGRSERNLAEEVAVAIVVNGGTLAVMMATPADLEAFGIGFALTEGVIESVDEIERLEVVDQELGIEVRLWVGARTAEVLSARRRRQAGPTGCGLCGIESLEQAMRPIEPVTARVQLSAEDVQRAMASLRPAQSLNAVTSAVHAAALWHPEQGILAVCEDVGRHNALDKLAGRAARLKLRVDQCAVLLTSRVSIELVQKAAMMGVPALIAVSAPTRMAAEAARTAGMSLIAVAREDGFEVFSD